MIPAIRSSSADCEKSSQPDPIASIAKPSAEHGFCKVSAVQYVGHANDVEAAHPIGCRAEEIVLH